MNRDESITLVNELCSEYRAVKVLQKKIDENGTLLRELTDTKPLPSGRPAVGICSQIPTFQECYNGHDYLKTGHVNLHCLCKTRRKAINGA